MSFASSVLLFLLALVTAAVYFIHHRYSLWQRYGAKYIKATFPYGSVKGLGTKSHMSQITKKFYDAHKKEPFVGIHIMLQPVAIACDLNFIQNVLVKDFSVFQERGLYWNEEHDPLSAHLFAIDGEKWKILRNKLSPTFTSGKMKLMFPLVLEKALSFEKKLASMVGDNPEIDIQDILARYTTDVIGSCAFGIESDSINTPDSLFREMGRREIEEPRQNSLQSFLLVSFRDWAKKINLKVVRDDVTEFFMKVVGDTVKYRQTNDVQRNDFMNILINMMQKEGQKIDDDKFSFNEVAAQAFVFFLAGFETSSTLLTFCSFELGRNPDVQERARQHVAEVLEKHNGEFSYEAMMDMKYLDQVLKESLRMYSPVTDLIRKASRDYFIPGSNCTVPKGTSIFIPSYAVHYDEDIYPEPTVFNPERFTEEEIQKRHPMAFLPFGEGPRNCVGLRFGMMQARVGLAALLTNFKFKLSERTVLPLVIQTDRILTKSKDTIYLNVEKL